MIYFITIAAASIYLRMLDQKFTLNLRKIKIVRALHTHNLTIYYRIAKNVLFTVKVILF